MHPSRAALVAAVFTVAVACKGESATPEPAEKHEAHEAGHEDEHAEGEASVVHLSPDQIKAAAIQLVPVEIRKETAVLEATGQIRAADDHQARVGVRVPGRVISFKAGVGDTVKKGQVLAVIESPELGSAKSDYVSAAAAAKLARENADREKQLFERKISAEVEWRKAEAEAVHADAELQAAENKLHALGVSDRQLPDRVAHFDSTFSVAAPIGGVVVERGVTLGEMASVDKSLFLIMDLAQVWLIVDVYERDLAQIAIGQRVKVTVTAYQDQGFEGAVSYIGAVVEPRSRSVPVRIALDNPGRRLKPGMFARVALADTKGDEHEHLFVPTDAVQRTSAGTIVFVEGDEPGEFVPRAVTTGHEAGASIAIESGLAPGERVVGAGAFILKSELGKASLGESGHSH